MRPGRRARAEVRGRFSHRRGDAAVADSRAAARSVVAQLEGQVLFAKLYNNTAPLEALWQNCLALLGARLPETGPVTV